MKPLAPQLPGKFSLPAFAVLITLSGQPGLAQEGLWYGGISGGESRAEVEQGSLITELRTNGYSTGELSVDERDMAAKVFGGYRFTRNLAVEASYFDLGQAEFQASVMPSAAQQGLSSINAFGLDLIGTLPLAEDYSAFVRAGINNAEVEQNFSNSAGSLIFVDNADRSTNEKYGIGVEFALTTTTITVRAELERYRIEGNIMTADHIDTYMIGFVYTLGAGRPAL